MILFHAWSIIAAEMIVAVMEGYTSVHIRSEQWTWSIKGAD